MLLEFSLLKKKKKKELVIYCFVYLNNNYFFRNCFLDSRDPCVGTSTRAVFKQIIDKKYDHDISSYFFICKRHNNY